MTIILFFFFMDTFFLSKHQCLEGSLTKTKKFVIFPPTSAILSLYTSLSSTLSQFFAYKHFIPPLSTSYKHLISIFGRGQFKTGFL